MKNLTILLLIIFLSGCNEGKVSTYAPAGNIKFKGFSVQAPSGWTGKQLQGIDSEVGFLTNGTDSLQYDLGWYNGGFKSLTTATHTIINIQVDGRQATVWQPKNSALHYTYFYVKIDDLNSLAISGKVTNQKEILAIFQSIKFS